MRCERPLDFLGVHLLPAGVDAHRSATGPLGRFAQNPDTHEATAEYGRQVIEAMIDRVGELADQAGTGPPDRPFLSFDDVEPAWGRGPGPQAVVGQLRLGVRLKQRAHSAD